MAERDDDERRDRHQRGLAAGVGAGAGFLLGLTGGPVAAFAGAAGGAALGPELEPLIRGVWTELRGNGDQNEVDVLFAAIHAGIPLGEMKERINASGRTQLLTGFALSAASRTAWEDKLRTLGYSLAFGLLAEDNAKIDTEQMIIAAIADIEGPQLAMLELLVAWRPGRHTGESLISGPLDLPRESHDRPLDDNWDIAWREWSRELIALARPNLAPIAPSLLGTLQRHGLVAQNTNTDETVERLQRAVESAFGQTYEYVRAGGGFSTRGAPRLNIRNVAQEPTWSPTELGEQVYLRFQEAGAGVEDVWTSGPDGGTSPNAERPASR